MPTAIRGFILLAVFGSSSCDQTREAAHIRIYEFDCGRLEYESPESAGFGFSDDRTDVRELLVPCYLVQHPNGLLLWDGGLSSDRLTVDLQEQLEPLGFSLDSLDFVAFSHMHFDHVGAANEIGGGVLLIQSTEFEAAFAEEVDVPGYDPGLYRGLLDLERTVLEGDHDVFGDGSVRILSLPGHTPGHQALYVDLAAEGPIVLSGDLYHFRVSRTDRAVPVFNVDREETLRSMDRLERLLVDQGATLWIEHDLERYLANRPPAGYHR